MDVDAMEPEDAEVKSFSCSICYAPLNSKSRGIFKISDGEEAKPVSDAAWADLFKGAFDETDQGEQCVCRQCHRLLEEYGNIEADLSECRRRILERFRSARPDIKPDMETLGNQDEKHTNGDVTESELMELANAAFLESQDLEDRLESIFHTDRSDGDLSPLTDINDSDFDCIKELRPLIKSPVKRKKKRRKLGNMHCQVCRVVFADVDKQVITEHYETHQAKEEQELAKFPYPCDVCGQRFSAKLKLKTHALRRHKEDQSESGSPRDDLQQCPVCDKIFETKRDFVRHVREHELNEESVFRCALCDVTFPSFSRLAKHSHESHKDDQKCKYGCPVNFKTKKEMDEHYRDHVNERPHSCEICGVRFENPRSLKQHERTHRQGRESFRCNLCDSTFSTRGERKQHLQTHGTNCEICGKSLSSVQTLVDHLRMHHQERKFACQMCGMLFSSQNALKAHVMRHAGGPKFQCEVCGKVFNYQTNLDAHCRAEHMVDATFKCPECPKHYGSHGSLRRHINSVHKLNRKYACNICGQTFLYSSSMLKHRRTHTGERKYPCPICHKAFSSWDNRYSHMFIHGDKKPFECTICGQGFPRKHHILTHLSSAHPLQFKPNEPEILIKKNQPSIPGAGAEMHIQEVSEDLVDAEKFHLPVVPAGHTILVTKDDGHTYQTVDGQTFLVATTGKHEGSLDHTILLPAGNLPTTIKTEHGAELLVSPAPGTASTAVEIQTSPLPGGVGTTQQLVPMLVPAGEDGDLQQPQFLLIPVS